MIDIFKSREGVHLETKSPPEWLRGYKGTIKCFICDKVIGTVNLKEGYFIELLAECRQCEMEGK